MDAAIKPSKETAKTLRLRELAQLGVSEILKEFHVPHAEEGLSAQAVRKARLKTGKNEITYEISNPWYKRLFNAFINPFNLVLLILAVTSFYLDVCRAPNGESSWASFSIITAMMFISGTLRFYQETKSHIACKKLKSAIKTMVSVTRHGKTLKIPMAELVPGDIIHLEAGSLLPADVRILSAKDLFINQAALTGESEPVEKFSELKSPLDMLGATELSNIAYMGSSVVSGRADALVLFTGKSTSFGALARVILEKRAPTSFDKGVSAISWMLIRLILVMTGVVFFLTGLSQGDWGQSLLFALAVAVGITPEMLPVIVTTNLAKGAISMSQHKVIIKNINSIQNLGAMDVLCTDKTGTLTEDRVVLELHYNADGEDDLEVLKFAYLNSFFQTGLQNMMDKAILHHGNEHHLEQLQKDYNKRDEIPFDFTRRRMSVVLENANHQQTFITKGAIDEVLAVCASVRLHGEKVPMTAKRIQKVQNLAQSLNESGMRTIAIAAKNEACSNGACHVSDENDLTFIGIVAFLDPIKASTQKTLTSLVAHGIQPKILTGDNKIVSQFVAKSVGLKSDNILTGNEIDSLSSEEFARRVEEVDVFCRLTPQQKIRIVQQLKNNGHTVGFLGDGINDAGAMRAADVGISVNTATDIAKESADILLLEKDLRVLEDGVLEGRKVFGNILKYIKMSTSSSFGNMLSILVAGALLPFLPMLPIQILTLNLLYDFSQTSIPWDNIDAEFLHSPHSWNTRSILSFTFWMGSISSIFDLLTFALMAWGYGWSSPTNLFEMSAFHSGWFLESLLTQILVFHILRTKKIPFFQSNASRPVYWITSTLTTIGILLPYFSIGQSIGLIPLPISFYIATLLLMATYCVTVQLAKPIYLKYYHEWL